MTDMNASPKTSIDDDNLDSVNHDEPIDEEYTAEYMKNRYGKNQSKHKKDSGDSFNEDSEDVNQSGADNEDDDDDVKDDEAEHTRRRTKRT